MATGLFKIASDLQAHQAQQDAAISALQTSVTALQNAPAGSVTPDQLNALAQQVTALAALVGQPDPAAPPASGSTPATPSTATPGS